jgi:hypothetical protein
MAIWHAGNIISNVISGFLAAGILEKWVLVRFNPYNLADQ